MHCFAPGTGEGDDEGTSVAGSPGSSAGELCGSVLVSSAVDPLEAKRDAMPNALAFNSLNVSSRRFFSCYCIPPGLSL